MQLFSSGDKWYFTFFHQNKALYLSSQDNSDWKVCKKVTVSISCSMQDQWWDQTVLLTALSIQFFYSNSQKKPTQVLSPNLNHFCSLISFLHIFIPSEFFHLSPITQTLWLFIDTTAKTTAPQTKCNCVSTEVYTD